MCCLCQYENGFGLFWHQFNDFCNICSSFRRTNVYRPEGRTIFVSPLRAFMNSNYDSMLMPRLHLRSLWPRKPPVCWLCTHARPACNGFGFCAAAKKRRRDGLEGNRANKIFTFAGRRENKQKTLHYFCCFRLPVWLRLIASKIFEKCFPADVSK